MKFKEFILENKFALYIIIGISLLCYGFAITNYSMGVDDEAIERFIINGEVLQQGRSGLYIINKNITLSRIHTILERFFSCILFNNGFGII